MTAYYNEIDPFAAAWLLELITAQHIAPGEVDTRSIEDVLPSDLMGFTQCHFFAGIGVWSYALRQVGWPDARPVWTVSCPCQPFSAAGKGSGFADERHLWPAFHHLISICHPTVIFGEQVASKDGLAWFDLVHADLEGEGYACGAVDTCAAGFGAPHIRQRLYWAAHIEDWGQRTDIGKQNGYAGEYRANSGTGGLAYAIGNGRRARGDCDRKHDGVQPCATCDNGGLAHAASKQEYEEQQRPSENERWRSANMSCGRCMVDAMPSPTNGFWGVADWLMCRDGKWRPVEPGTFPLAYGAANRVGRLRGYGNAIVAPQAEAFIRAYMDTQWEPST